jgi:hypothetical protein
MKRIAFVTLLFCGLAGCVLRAQQAVNLDRPAEPNFVFDDDGGKAQIVPSDFSVTGPKSFHGGPVLTSARQVSIFLGAGWGDQQFRQREAALVDIAGGSASPQMGELQAHHVKALRAAPRQEDFSDMSKTQLNDLDIQRKLSEMLQSKAIPAPSASTIYVVFLAPGTSSTLGGHKAGVDYAAYHNFVNLDSGEIHYVVVPFHENVDHHTAAAARAFVETALNPNGQGWF